MLPPFHTATFVQCFVSDCSCSMPWVLEGPISDFVSDQGVLFLPIYHGFPSPPSCCDADAT